MTKLQAGAFHHQGISSFGAGLALTGLLLLTGQGISQPVTLTDAGSSATIDLVNGGGMNNWSVLGQNQLVQQWFWYRTDNGVAQPLNSIGGLTYNTYIGNNGTINEVDAIYQNAQLSVEIDYLLSGGGLNSGSAGIIETITARNLSGNPLNLNFYEYSYFSLQQSGNNSLTINGNPLSGYNHVLQTSGTTAIQEAVLSPAANYAEAALYNQTLNALNSQAGLTLNDNASAGPGNVTWAFQWDQTLGAGGQLDVLQNNNLSISATPEPSTVALIVLSAGALGLGLRRKLS